MFSVTSRNPEIHTKKTVGASAAGSHTGLALDQGMRMTLSPLP
jgi:hypothetical protein